MTRLIVVVVLVAMVCGVSACGGVRETEPVTYADQAREAFEEAEHALDRSNYMVALSQFRQVRDSFELSPYSTLAELRIADVYFEQGSYLQAAQTYRQFIQLHPNHEAVPYARFRIGMSYHEDMPSSFFLFPPPWERELGSTRQAHRLLRDFLTRYRDHDDELIHGYLEQAAKAFDETTNRLAGYNLYVAEFYLERERPVAAADHLLALIEEFPASELTAKALFLLARSYIELSDVVSALLAIQHLQIEFPEHQLTKRALEWMRRHQLSFQEIPEGQHLPTRSNGANQVIYRFE